MELKRVKMCKTLCLVLSDVCNRKCVFCCRYMKNDISTKKAKQILKLNINKYDSVRFTGGEPLLRKDLCELISYAKKIGYSPITIVTNGSIFNDKAIKRMIACGLDRFIISFFSNNKKVFDEMTNVKGSFEQTVRFIKKLTKYKAEIRINSVITSLNYRDLPYLVSFIHKNFRKVSIINFMFLMIVGKSQKNKWIVPDNLKIKPYINQALSLCCRYNIRPILTNVPFCIFDPRFYRYVINSRPKTEFGKRRQPRYHIKSAECRICKLYKICPGVLKDYFDVFSMNGTSPITRIDPSYFEILNQSYERSIKAK